MAQPRIYFCKFKDSIVEPLAEFTTMPAAEQCVNLHNNTVVGPNGELDNEFWFLNKIEGKKSRIIIISNNQYHADDSKFFKKLAPYLEEKEKEKEKKDKGSFQSRGYRKGYDPK